MLPQVTPCMSRKARGSLSVIAGGQTSEIYENAFRFRNAAFMK